jgi:hypothetical protein
MPEEAEMSSITKLSLVTSTLQAGVLGIALGLGGLVMTNSALAHEVSPLVQAQYQGYQGRVRLSVNPADGWIGTRVLLSARGIRPGSRVVVLGGRNPADLRPVTTARADANGRIFVRVRVPEWARPERNFFFALQSSGGRILAQSRPFRVVRQNHADERVSVTGEILRSTATCPRLAADNGRIYTLTGDLEDFAPGDRVRVTGEIAEVSICQQGRTITVRRIRDAE